MHFRRRWASRAPMMSPATPLIQLASPSRAVPLYAKLESANPTGSIKDRIAAPMVEAAERSGALRSNVLVEATSGNTGLALAALSAAQGFKFIAVVPAKISSERVAALTALGSEVVICDSSTMTYVEAARELADREKAHYIDQYSNPENPLAHYRSTGPEVWSQTNGKVTHFVCGIGTGGTVTGVGRYLKERNPAIRVIGVDPEGSIFSSPDPHPYLLEGIGKDFWPETFDPSVVDEIVTVHDLDAFMEARALACGSGLLVGGSSGAVLAACRELSERAPPDSVFVVILPDTGRNYLSTFFADAWLAAHFGDVPTVEPWSQVSTIKTGGI